jgi:hypothetical protein
VLQEHGEDDPHDSQEQQQHGLGTLLGSDMGQDAPCDMIDDPATHAHELEQYHVPVEIADDLPDADDDDETRVAGAASITTVECSRRPLTKPLQ